MTETLLGRRFHGIRIPAWQNNGYRVNNPIPVEEALERGGLNHVYVDSPIGYALPDGTFRDRGDKKVILRSPPGRSHAGRAVRLATIIRSCRTANLPEASLMLIDRTGWQRPRLCTLAKAKQCSPLSKLSGMLGGTSTI